MIHGIGACNDFDKAYRAKAAVDVTPERGGSHANHCSLDTYGTIGATGIAFVANDAITLIEARRAGYSN
jgi:hypothetical protein